ncbi:MAG TPA: hypothetical protein VD930_13525 [Gemmatimonadales bacterium]|nr:hypothetical protein [Gemmatimonadales bacterium]
MRNKPVPLPEYTVKVQCPKCEKRNLEMQAAPGFAVTLKCPGCSAEWFAEDRGRGVVVPGDPIRIYRGEPDEA